MDERQLRNVLDDVRAGRLSRRAFLESMLGFGLTAPLVAQMVAAVDVASAQPKPAFSPTKRGGGGLLKTLWWQAPTLLNPHFATGTKDQDACRIFYEPLASYDPDGNVVPILAADVPSLQNGLVAKDGLTVTWRLRKNATWHDGKPFTADDVAFNWEYAADSVSAARAVLQTGEYDYAWNMQVEDDILKRLEQSGKGRIDAALGGNIEHIQLNQTDPWTEVEGEKSSIKTRHPFLTDLAVRQAQNLLVDRGAVQEQIYGRTGIATANFLNAPPRVQSKTTKWEFNVDRASQILESAGWKRGADGIRAKDGKKLKLVYQTSINAPRQKNQQIVKQACAKAGIDVDIKSVTPSVYFSSDAANPDTYSHFSTDVQMYTTTMTQPDPQRFMDQFVSWEVAAKANQWQGRNVVRWRNDEYDRTWKAAEAEMDPVKRAAHFIKMNDLLIQNIVVIPVVWRPRIAAISARLRDATQSGWDSDFWNVAHWWKQA